MNKKIKILKENLNKSIWYEKSYKIAPYLTEERGKYVGKSNLLLKPRTTKEVSQILTICYKNKISIVPQGGRTGLSGGTIPNPNKNEVIISMEKMNKILSIEENNSHIAAQAGCTLINIRKQYLLENHIIDVIKDDSHSYNVMKSQVGWENNGVDMNNSGYFIYRDDNEALYELVYPSYFNYYGGIWDDQNEVYDDNGWTPHAQNQDSVLFYLPFRDGEIVETEYFQIFDDTTMIDGSSNGTSANYHFKTKYEVNYGDTLVVQGFSDNGLISEDKTFSDVFKVIRQASITMIGSGVMYNEKQTYWLAKDYGIVKQLIEYSWGDYEMVTAHEWTISRYNESAPSSPIILNSLDELANQFGEADGTQVSSLFYAAFILMILSLLVNIFAQFLVKRFSLKYR